MHAGSRTTGPLMDRTTIEEKMAELQSLLVQYRSSLGGLEKDLLAVISEYHAALKEERLRELKKDLTPGS